MNLTRKNVLIIGTESSSLLSFHGLQYKVIWIPKKGCER